MSRTFKAASTMASAAKQAPTGHRWGERLRALPATVSAVLSGRSHAGNRFAVFASLMGLLYVISPIDLIPELLLGPLAPFGLADDLGIAVVSVAYLVKTVDAYLNEPDGATPAGHAGGGTTSGNSDVIPGVVLHRSDDPAA